MKKMQVNRNPTPKKPRTRKQYSLKASIYDKRGRLLSTATNSYEKTHPFQYRMSCEYGNGEQVYLHAEIAALLKIKDLSKAYSIFIERYAKDGSPVSAKPCPVCAAVLKEYEIEIEHT